MTLVQFNRRLEDALAKARRRASALERALRGEVEVVRVRVTEHVVREHRVQSHWRLVPRRRGAT